MLADGAAITMVVAMSLYLLGMQVWRLTAIIGTGIILVVSPLVESVHAANTASGTDSDDL